MPWFTGWASPWLAVGKHHDGSPWSARTTVLGLQPADDPHFYYLDNTGTLFFGPCGPGGGPYGRREHGRFRRSAGRNPRDGKGVNVRPSEPNVPRCRRFQRSIGGLCDVFSWTAGHPKATVTSQAIASTIMLVK